MHIFYPEFMNDMYELLRICSFLRRRIAEYNML